ncbi:MAG: metal-sensing transcriptional repressor [Bdellovibrionales bacterium]|nr:metal-sensing transcriptional repressor [Bdellovibrionales bacterium]
MDNLTQIKAAKSSKATNEKKIINEHIEHCLHKAIHSKDKKMADLMLEEIQELLKSRG